MTAFSRAVGERLPKKSQVGSQRKKLQRRQRQKFRFIHSVCKTGEVQIFHYFTKHENCYSVCVTWKIHESSSFLPVLQKGDTPLHIAIRGRSRKLAELLLRNPKDGRLLYRPNKAGETPYNIDCSHQKSILTQIFGASKYWVLFLTEL